MGDGGVEVGNILWEHYAKVWVVSASTAPENTLDKSGCNAVSNIKTRVDIWGDRERKVRI